MRIELSEIALRNRRASPDVVGFDDINRQRTTRSVRVWKVFKAVTGCDRQPYWAALYDLSCFTTR